ncbi:P2 phage tail completion protein R (GpR) [compost metagenome]
MNASQGYYLQALHQALTEAMPSKIRGQLDSWMENGSMRLEPKDMGPTGAILGYLSYQAVYTIEALPFRECDPAVLLAAVMAWLQDHDLEREQQELPDPEFSIEPNDEHSADLDLQIAFVEPLRLVPDAQGPIHWGGQRWAVLPYEIWVAESALLQVGSIQPPASIGGGA